MDTYHNKVMALSEAIHRFVKPGCHLSIGGFTLNRNPMAAIHEIIRRGIGNLHMYVHSNGVGLDELIGAGLVSRLEIAYSGTGKSAPTCIRFRKAVEENAIQIEDYSNYMMTLRFLAGAMGVPFLPTLSGFGSDILKRWGFSEELRRGDDKIVNRKLRVIDNPFEDWMDVSKVVAVPAINPEVSIVHVQQADPMGTCRIQGLTFADVEQVKASHNVIVTCEELVAADVLRRVPDHNQIPFIHVSAVCHIPYGAWPTAVFNHYDYDAPYLREYAAAARDDARFKELQETYILSRTDHRDLLKYIGSERLNTLKADSRTGYAVNMKRT